VTTAAELQAAIGDAPGHVVQIWDGVAIEGGPQLTAPMHDIPNATRIDRYVLPDTPNGRGAEACGMLPRDGGLNTLQMFEAARDGKLDVLAILGANPVLRFPDRALAEEALRTVPFVVVTDLFLTETAELANLVLPVCSAFEKTGTTTDLAGDVLPVVGSVRPPEGILADGDIMVDLAGRLGVSLPLPDEMEAEIRALVHTAPPAPVPYYTRATAAAAGGALRVIPHESIFTGGGTLAFDTTIAELHAAPRATIHPATARALALADGDMVDAAGENGQTLRALTVQVDDRVPEGAVGLLDGIVLAPLNALGLVPSVRLQKALVTA
jgi:anaerobic selenocysteine-containing dehydrogenase